MSDEDDFLMGGGGTSAKFDVGTVVRGKILSKALRQRLDINDGTPMTWPDGRKQMQLVVALQTDEIDDEIEDDDGVRNVYIRYKMREAVQKAVKDAKAKTLEIGGVLAIKCVGQEKPRKRGQQGTKLYRAKYTAPDPAEYLEDGMGEEDDYAEDTPPAKKAPAKKAAKKAPTRRQREPEPEPDDDDDLADDEPAPRRSAGKKTAKKAAARREVDEFSDGDDDDDPGF